jgi:type II secretory pathway component PulC
MARLARKDGYMDWNNAVSLIGSLGFPIVACVWLAMSFKKSIDANTQANNKLIESNIKMTDSNNNIAAVLGQVCAKLNLIDPAKKEV